MSKGVIRQFADQRFLLTILILLSTIICFIFGSRIETSGDVSQAFIEAVATGNEGKAERYLSARAYTAVETYCPNGSVIAYFDQYGRVNWGEPGKFMFVYGTTNPGGSETEGYTVVWNTESRGYTDFEITTRWESRSYRVDAWQVEGDAVFPPE